jgi:hypothetical protein
MRQVERKCDSEISITIFVMIPWQERPASRLTIIFVPYMSIDI